MSRRFTLAYLKTETGSGLLLAAIAVFAIAWASSPWGGAYRAIVSHEVPFRLGPFAETMTVGGWVKSALMPVFFYVLGLELKHEVLKGELANPRRLALPLLAALGGVLAPAAIYLLVHFGARGAGADGGLRGWAVPTQMDIAFALAALAAAGPRLPSSLRTFLLTAALATEVVGVLLIGLLFTSDLQPRMLVGAAASLIVLAAMGRWRQAPYAFWALGGLLLWGFTLKSGVDPALAGVLLAFCMPLGSKTPSREGVLIETMSALHPYVAYVVLPLFAFTAAGFDLRGLQLGPVGAGVALALFVGKPLGVFGAASLAIGLKWARRPTGVRWVELLGVSALCGVGFTLSLYFAALAFPEAAATLQAEARAGVALGSLASALLGMLILRACAARHSGRPD